MDANRMTLAFFTVSALDLLGVLFTRTTLEERNNYINWIYRCQHPDGGFRGFPGTDFGDRSNESNRVWDPANLPATYFALSSLCILGDDLKRVQRNKTLQWLPQLQRQDGSFGEWLSENGHVEGGMDTRYAYCGVVVRWILRGTIDGFVDGVPDVDVDKLVACIRESQSFDGGIADEPYHESHAGFTYCALSALSAVNRLPLVSSSSMDFHPRFLHVIKRWLVSRLTTDLEVESDLMDTDASSDLSAPASTPDTTLSDVSGAGKEVLFGKEVNAKEAEEIQRSDERSTALPSLYNIPAARWTGFAGRSNKKADTCYAWWVEASLAQLGCLDYTDGASLRRYLLAKTQHMMAGGFGKMPGDPPDIYHSYLGLATLSVMGVGLGEEAVLGPAVEDTDRDEIEKYDGLDVANKLDHEEGVLRKIDSVLCMSVRAREWVKRLEWRQEIVLP